MYAMKKAKRVCSLFLCLLMIVSIMPVSKISVLAVSQYAVCPSGTISWATIYEAQVANADSYYWYHDGEYCKLTAEQVGSAKYVTLWRSDKDEKRYLKPHKDDDSGSKYDWGNDKYTGGYLYKQDVGTSGGTVLADGTYTAISNGSVADEGEMYKAIVTLTVSNGKVTAITATGPTDPDNLFYFNRALTGISNSFIGQSALPGAEKNIDSVSGATKSYRVITDAIGNALNGNLYQEETGGGDTPSGNGLIPDGTYTKTSTTSFNKDSETYYATVTITVSGGVVTSVTASGPTKSSKNISYFNKAINGIKSQLVNETADSSIKSFDSVSGATKSSQLIRNAVQQIVSENIDSSSSSSSSAKTYYVLTSTLTSGKKYIIINRNYAGSGVALGSISDSKFSPVSLTVKSADSTINSPYIDTADTDCVYTITGSASSFTMKNNSGNFIRIYDKKASTTSQSSATSLKYASNKISYYDSKKGETRYIYYKSDKNEYKFESSGTSLYFYEEYTPPAPAKTYTVKFYTYDGELIKSYTAEEGTYPSALLESAYQNPSRDSTDAYDYTFNGWARDMYQTDGTKLSGLPKLTENVSYYQAFVATPRKYAVTWKNWDKTNNNETSVSYIEYGDRPVYPNSGTPEKADDSNYTYTFSGWSTSPNQTQGTAIEDLPDVTEAITYYACFTPNPVMYTVTWKNYDGVTLATESVAYGHMPSYTGTTPAKPQQGRTVYTHSGWTPEITAITGNVTYTATFSESTLIDDGIYGDNSITVQNYGYIPIVAVEVEDGRIKNIYADADTGGYNSRCMTNALEGIREQLLNKSVSEADNVDAVSGATLSSNALIAEIRKGLSEDPKPPYTVTWKDYDNSVIKTQSNIMYGTRTAYDDDIPVREADADYSYTFDKWNPDLSVFVTENKTYTAAYSSEQNVYTLDLGDDITLNLNDMTFTGADILSGCYDYNNDGNDNICVYPKDVVFTVNGKQISARTEGKYGLRFVSEDTAIAENCDNDWWFELTGQQGTTTVHAQVFDIVSGKTLAEKDITIDVIKPALYVNVIWKNYNGDILKSEAVAIGNVPSYRGDTPAKAATAQYTYTFSGWDKPLTAATEDITYTATFNEILREYTVTWKNYDGTVLRTDEIPYGEIPDSLGIKPTKKQDSVYTYEFSGWKAENSQESGIEAVSGDISYIAQYNAVQTGYRIFITDYTNGKAEISGVTSGEYYRGEVKLTVKADNAAAFGIDNGDGTYTRLYCTEKTGGFYEFKLNITDHDIYVVAGFKGDCDVNGKVTLRDTAILSRYLVGTYQIEDGISKFLGDSDGNGKLTLRDSAMIARYTVRTYEFLWDTED